MLTNRLFATCLVAACLTFAVSSVSVFGGESCGDKAAKASGSSCCPAMQVATKKSDCPVENAARAYLAQVTKIGKANGSECCPGANAMKGLMTVLSEDEAYRPMVAQFEAFMDRQANAQTVAMTTGSDCSSSCGSTQNAALASTKSDCSQPCDGVKNAALAGTKSDCSQPCGTPKNAALAGTKSDCSQPCDGVENAALASTKAGDCCGSCDGVKNTALAGTKSDCSQPCGTPKNAALASAKNDCSQPCDGVKNAALASTKAGDCCGSCDGVKNAALAGTKSDCSQPCDGVKNAALASAKNDCSQPCDGVRNAALASTKAGDCCGSCVTASPANYLTYECTKCDTLARTAAEAYLSLMMEIKKVAGAEGCPMQAADLTLAAVMADMQNATQAEADVKARTVSLGSVSEKKSDGCSSPCEAVTKK
ncbi:MAG: hypothetical protein SYC29_04635 [Planctomycetota bacterium]|nr:hypothetical protein [Planctomycetota bacterium]